jgi:MoaA/NifB/PqqE/SkfB family radical SAM enzyme
MKQMVFPNVPKKFETMPNGFVNNVNGWFFNKKEVADAAEKKSLLTMDIDMAGKGVCSLRCGHCFRRSRIFQEMKTDDFASMEILRTRIDEAIALGLKTIKLIGPGEPLEDPKLIPLLKELHQKGITVLIFTKAYILGNDEKCKRIHGMNGKEMIEMLDKLGVSLLVGVTSFDQEIEEKIVGREGFHTARQEAIERLCNAGFNDFAPGKATRLAMVFNPITPQNIDEIFEAYVWARERNIQPISATTMVAGNAIDGLCQLVPDREQLIELYLKINIWAIEHGILTIEDIREYGIAAYAGGHWCNQVATGVFMRGDGTVLRCPGDDITILGNLKEKTLAEIWLNSENLREYAGKFNNGCPPKEGKNSACASSFPEGFFDEVKKRVLEYFGTS